MIPKIAYFFWGNKHMSWLRYMSIASFCKHNPTWKVFLYLNEPVQKHAKYILTDEQRNLFETKDYENYFDRLKDLPIEIKQYEVTRSGEDWSKLGANHKSNFFKWQMMATDGGVFSDMDIFYIRPIDKLIENIGESNTMLCMSERGLQIGLLASSGNNPWYADVLERTFASYIPGDYNSCGVGPIRDTYRIPNDIESRFPDCRVYNMPPEVVYPIGLGGHMGEISTLFESNLDFEKYMAAIVPNMYIAGIHWWAASNYAQKWNKLLTEKTCQDFNTMFCKILQKYL